MKIITRTLLMLLGRILGRLLFKITITGQENLPHPSHGRLLIISNHFSWFEPFLIGIKLRQYHIHFYAAAELKDKLLFRPIIYAFEPILVRRGQIDRDALRLATDYLDNNHMVAIFPEGGIDPDLRERINRGEPIHEVRGHTSRESAELISARPGAAYLATRTFAPILPIAFLGTEKTLHNLRRGRRTAVSMIIGPIFGPLALQGTPHGAERRRQLDTLAHDMMRHLAALIPPKHRGPYH